MKGIKILVVEDDLFSFKLIKKYLSKEHEIVGNAVSLEEAVVLFHASMPDLVLMDIQLEGSPDGIYTSELLTKIKPVPVIYITGTDPENMKLLKGRIIESNPYAFLRKPLNFEELKMIVELSFEKFKTQNKMIMLNEQLQRITKESEKYQYILQTALEEGNILIWEYALMSGQYMVSGSWLKQLAVNRDNGLTQIFKFEQWCENIYTADYLKMNEEINAFLTSDKDGFEIEYRLLTADSHYIWILTRGKVFERKKDKITKLIGTHVNITDRKAVEKELKAYASRDSLTKTYNRDMGMQYLTHQILKAKKGKIPLTAAYVDIDNLKKVNDTYGHDMGDELIRQVVNILKGCLRGTDIICRLGGDEFLLIFTNCGVKNANKIMKRIIGRIHAENLEGLYPFVLGISFGIEQYDESLSLSSDDYIKRLDTLMYRQKRQKH